MKDENGQAQGEHLLRRLHEGRRARRAGPITYTFNGGPGSSSVWLHMGAVGPEARRHGRRRAAASAAVPARRQRSDLARVHRPRLHRSGHDRLQPARRRARSPSSSTASRRTCSRSATSSGSGRRATRRWASPKFLAGESYGTTRAAGLSGYLQDRHGMYLNGIVLISTILNFQTADFNVGNDLPYVTFLPTLHDDRLVPQEAAARSAGELLEGASTSRSSSRRRSTRSR